MRRRTTLGSLAGAGLVGAVGLAGAHLTDRRRVAADPEHALFFEHPEGGEEVAVRAPDGTRLHVEQFGPEDAPPVVLIHGWTCALRFWRRQIRDLMPDHRVIAYDLRGHGRSGTPDGGDWSPDALADDLQAVLDACLFGRKALLVGHSLGAMTIVAWAGRHPDQVTERASAAVLCNTGLGDLVSESLLLRPPDAFGRLHQTLGGLLLGAAAPLPSRPDPITHRAVRYVALSPSASPAAVAFSEDLVLNTHPRVRGACGREITRLDLRERVEHLTVPTVVIAGTADRLTPPVHARSLAEALPECRRLLEIEGSGHMGPLEHADEVTRVLRELAASGPQPPPRRRPRCDPALGVREAGRRADREALRREAVEVVVEAIEDRVRAGLREPLVLDGLGELVRQRLADRRLHVGELLALRLGDVGQALAVAQLLEELLLAESRAPSRRPRPCPRDRRDRSAGAGPGRRASGSGRPAGRGRRTRRSAGRSASGSRRRGPA